MLDKLSLKPVIEALIFAAETPLTIERMAGVLEGEDKAIIKEALAEVIAEYKERAGGLYIEEVAGGYIFRTNPEFAPHLRRLFKIGLQKISKAAMETLAVIAYKQPVTRAELEAIRGVDSGGVLATLMEKRFIKVVGRKEVPGRPVVYGTTKEFLETFDLKDLSCLPSLKDIQRMEEENAAENPEGSKDSIEDSIQINPEDEADIQGGVQEGASAPTEEELPDRDATRAGDKDGEEVFEAGETCPDETEPEGVDQDGDKDGGEVFETGETCPDETEPEGVDQAGDKDGGEVFETGETCPDETEPEGVDQAGDKNGGEVFETGETCPDETEPEGVSQAGDKEGREGDRPGEVLPASETVGEEGLETGETCPDETEPGEASEDNSSGRGDLKEKG